jgi:septal ring factor EnvC (AmiA/AmiB activator)
MSIPAPVLKESEEVKVPEGNLPVERIAEEKPAPVEKKIFRARKVLKKVVKQRKSLNRKLLTEFKKHSEKTKKVVKKLHKFRKKIHKIRRPKKEKGKPGKMRKPGKEKRERKKSLLRVLESHSNHPGKSHEEAIKELKSLIRVKLDELSRERKRIREDMKELTGEDKNLLKLVTGLERERESYSDLLTRTLAKEEVIKKKKNNVQALKQKISKKIHEVLSEDIKRASG